MVTIEKQKKIMWIPYVNWINMFFCLYNSRTIKLGSCAWWMFFVYYFGLFIGVSALAMLLGSILPSGSLILTVYIHYLSQVIISCGMIQYQKKYLKL